MDENVKNKNADPARDKRETSALDEGLEETFPASDAVSSTTPGEHADDAPKKRR